MWHYSLEKWKIEIIPMYEGFQFKLGLVISKDERG
jgi:hypothetical protein